MKLMKGGLVTASLLAGALLAAMLPEENIGLVGDKVTLSSSASLPADFGGGTALTNPVKDAPPAGSTEKYESRIKCSFSRILSCASLRSKLMRKTEGGGLLQGKFLETSQKSVMLEKGLSGRETPRNKGNLFHKLKRILEDPRGLWKKLPTGLSKSTCPPNVFAVKPMPPGARSRSFSEIRSPLLTAGQLQSGGSEVNKGVLGSKTIPKNDPSVLRRCSSYPGMNSSNQGKNHAYKLMGKASTLSLVELKRKTSAKLDISKEIPVQLFQHEDSPNVIRSPSFTDLCELQPKHIDGKLRTEIEEKTPPGSPEFEFHSGFRAPEKSNKGIKKDF